MNRDAIAPHSSLYTRRLAQQSPPVQLRKQGTVEQLKYVETQQLSSKLDGQVLASLYNRSSASVQVRGEHVKVALCAACGAFL
jgi:hypothetical protein